jgi:enolase
MPGRCEREQTDHCRDQVSLAIDAAANGFHNEDGAYSPQNGMKLSSEQMCDWWCEFVDNAPIVMLEDPLDEDDFDGWRLFARSLGDRLTIVGDDIFVTDAPRIRRAIRDGIANAALLKPNQIGTVSETIDAWRAAGIGSVKTVLSHRSGETGDTFISDLSVGTGSEYMQSGAPARGERVAKYNRLLEIERELGSS